MQILGRLKPHWAWIVSVVLVAGALTVVFSTGPDAPALESRPGQYIEAYTLDKLPARHGTLTFPAGTLAVAVSTPIDFADLDEDDVRSHFEGRASIPGGSYLRIRLELDRADHQSVAVPSGSYASESPFAIVVIADGRRYRLPDHASTSGYLAVSGHPDDVRVEVSQGGLRQVVRPATGERETGRAQALYTRTEKLDRRRTCTKPRLTSGFRFTDKAYDVPRCEIYGSVRTPYLDGVGLAAPGHVWQYVELDVDRSLRVDRPAPSGPQRYVSVRHDDQLDVRIDGRRSVGSARDNAGSGLHLGDAAIAAVQVLQDAPPSTVQIVATYRRMVNVENDPDPAAPVDPDVSVTWTETLR